MTEPTATHLTTDARSTLDGLSDLLKSWETSAGAASPGGIEPAIYLDQAGLDDLYRANTYAQRICDALPDEATRRGWAITYGEQDDDEADQGDPIGDELWRLQLRRLLNQAGKLARKDGLAALYIGAWDGQDVREPIDETRLQKVTHLTLIERDQIQPWSWQTDFSRPGFGEPEVYQITPYSGGGATTGVQTGTAYVHRSRLILLEGKWLPPRLQVQNANSPDSVLQRCWRLVQDFRRTEGDVGVILRTFSTGSLTMPALQQLLSSGNRAQVMERIGLVNLSRQVFGLALLGDGEKLDYVTRSVAGLADLYDRLAQGLAAAAEMPLTLLFGHSPSGLSTDDNAGRTYWRQRVASYQTNELQPHVESVGHLVALAKQGPCKGTEPERWECSWLPLDEPTEGERIEQRGKQSETDERYWRMGVLDEKEIRSSRFGSGAYSAETTLLKDEIEEPAEVPEIEEPEQPEASPAVGGAAGEGVGVQAAAGDVVLNGAQVTSLMEIVTAVAAGTLPRESGAAIIMAAFRMSPEQTTKILGPIEVGSLAPPAAPPGRPPKPAAAAEAVAVPVEVPELGDE